MDRGGGGEGGEEEKKEEEAEVKNMFEVEEAATSLRRKHSTRGWVPATPRRHQTLLVFTLEKVSFQQLLL
ncbi:hypothetical protein Hamer_G001200 [Homarus americanus]|uniref:Uncharacterized protein n=1 Tax=Homarus americanus TaxID=6706 RepID=A0A8J5TIN5_HOMAM|nr:hypothetical protein Hamer_G001200 [Homarus americanus]